MSYPQLIVVAREDDYTFGILQSRVHELWARAMGTQLETRPRYTPTTAFSPLAAPVLERLVSGASQIAVPAGTPVVTEGEVGDRFYVILSGSMRVSAAGRVLASLGVGEGFGEIALLRDVPRTATVTAVEPVELLAVDRSGFLEALTGQPRSRSMADAVVARHLLSDGQAAAAPGQGPEGRP